MNRQIWIGLASLAYLALSPPTSTAQTEGSWDEQFGIYVPPFEPGDVQEFEGRLYASIGYYSDAYGSEVSLAVWDGMEWSRLTGDWEGLLSERGWHTLEHLEVHEGRLLTAAYAEDRGSPPDWERSFRSRISGWDGSSWTRYGADLPGRVDALFIHAGQPHASLSVRDSESGTTYQLVRWDGSSWQPVPGTDAGRLSAYYSDGDDLLAAGAVTLSDETVLAGILAWDGSSWRRIAGSPVFEVRALVRHEGELLAGGSTREPGENILARWDGAAWQPFAGGIHESSEPHPYRPNFIGSFSERQNELIVIGRFQEAGGIAADNVAAWNGASWRELGGGLDSAGSGIATMRDTFVAYGGFNVAGDRWVEGLAEWTGQGWAELRSSQGVSGVVDRLFPMDDGLWANGGITAAGGAPMYDPVSWDGAGWTKVSLPPSVRALRAFAEHDGHTYAAGKFGYDSADTIAYSPVARREGDEWIPVIADWGGETGTAVCSWGSKLAVGIQDWPFPEPSFGRIAIHDGESVARFDVGEGREVNSIVVFRDELVIGGVFFEVGGTRANMVAAFDGTSWRHLVGGVGGEVKSLLVMDNALVVGGHFNVVGDNVQAKSIARWDGVGWSALGEGFAIDRGSDSYSIAVVNAMTAHQGELHVTGWFDQSGAEPTLNIARWDGAKWLGLGAGVGNFPPYSGGEGYAITSWDGDLYVGGVFWQAGGHNSRFFARWILPQMDVPSAGVALRSIAPNPLNPTTTITYAMSREDQVRVDIYDVRGRHIARLVDGVRDAGPHDVAWDGLEDDGSPVASGVYYVRVSGAGGADRGKVTVVK